MKTIVFNIPDTVDIDDKEVLLTVASLLHEKGKLSLGQAAEMVGLTKRAFMEIAGKYGLNIFNYPITDLESDIQNAKNYNR
jgi:predicted HTH domain antitoxin